MAFQITVRIPQLPELDKQRYLFEADIPMKKQSGFICDQFGLEPDHYRFAYEEAGKIFYYTEDNRTRLKEGDTVLLMRSPALVAQSVKTDLDSCQKDKVLSELTKFVYCPEFAEQFMAVEGMEALTEAVAGGHLNGVDMNNALNLIRVLFGMGAGSSRFYTTDFLKRLCAELAPCPEHQGNVEVTFSVLSLLAQSAAAEIFLHLPFEHIVDSLSHVVPSVAKNVLQLLHTLLDRLNETDRAKLLDRILEFSDELSEQLLARYDGGHLQRNTALQRELSLFQTRLLRARYLHRYDEGRDEAHVDAFHRFLAQILRTQLGRSDPTSERYIDALKGIGGSAEEYEDVLRPGKRFLITIRRIDGLTLHCIKYFEKHHSTVFYPWMKEINILPSEYICPLLQSSILLTDLIVEILHIRSEPPGKEPVAMRMFLTNPRYFFEEFFSIGLKQVLKTWREMRARSGDIEKVFAIVHEQLTMALDNQMTCWCFEQLQAMLHATPYTLISQKLEVEQASTREDSKRQEMLTEQLSDKIWELVKESKILKLIEGFDFDRINKRGNRVKNKSVIVRLSNDRLQLRVIVDHQTLAIPLGTVQRVDIMKQCQHFRKDDFSLSILVSKKGQAGNGLASVPVATMDRETFENLWDALHALTGRQLESESAQSDYRLLMELELKLASVELEGIELPEVPPVIPAELEDLDFRDSWSG